MYRPPTEKSPPWWLEALVLTRVVLGVLFWPLVAIVGGLIAVLGLLFAFSAGLGWGLLVLALIAACVAVFAWWERRHPPRL